MTPTRRQFLKSGTLAGVSVITAVNSANAGAQTASSTLKYVTTPILNIAYEEHGPAAGFPIILLHGFPYDVRSFDGVVPRLSQTGFRVLVPFLRGYGPTRFLDSSTPPMAEQAALAQDLIDFCDALALEQVAVAGFDWGNRAACVAAISHPQRFKGIVAIGGYAVQDTVNKGRPAPAAAEARLWYQWYFNTDRGKEGLESNRHEIIRYLWDTWSPTWTYSDEDYQRSAASFDNPDFVAVSIHSYRHRHLNAPGEARFLDLEKALALRPPIEIPAIVLHGADSGFGAPSTNPAADQARFSNLVARRIVPGAGHDLPAHRPDSVAEALLELL